MRGFHDVRAYVRGRGIVRCDIGIEDGRIGFVGQAKTPPTPPADDMPSGLLCAGFIDEHVHGAAGADSMDGTKEGFAAMAKALAAEGTTAFLVTTMTAPVDTLDTVLASAAAYAAEEPRGAALLGVHLEGPFLSPARIGAQDPSFLQIGNEDAVRRLCRHGNVRLVTLAPEQRGAEALVKAFRAHGVRVSAGHSDASAATMREAMAWGLDGVTHTYNAMSPLHHREVGLVGSALLYDPLFCEVIADGLHVSGEALQLLFKNKPHDRVVLITDAMRGKGMPNGVYDLGGQAVTLRGQEARLADGTLAGSVLRMNEAVRNAVQFGGVTKEEALDMASYNAALRLGVEHERGSIAVGKRADFTVLDENYEVLMTVVGGTVVYRK